MDKHTFIFAGRSGSGKGTQVELLQKYISEKYPEDEIFHYYSGDGFRKLIKEEGYTNDLARAIIKEGGLQPNFLAVWLWSTAFVEKMNGKQHVFIDGSPRALVEAEAMDSAMKFYKRHKPHMIVINVDKETSKERLLARKRDDDTVESIEKRVAWYDTDVMPAVEFYRDNSDYHFIEVNGEQSIEDVHEEIISKLNLE